jgi:uncharacterized protein (DUF1697 family)
MKYVALLRGINVGGKNKVGMKQLALALEQAGFLDVSTYINSGNIFFSDEHDSTLNLQKKIEKLIADEFGLNIKALVLDKPSIDVIVDAIPKNWTNDTDMKCDVMFLWDKYHADSIVEQLPIKPDIDTVKYIQGAVIWGVARDKVTKSGLLRIIGTDMYAHMTIRNCNTARKIQHIMNQEV